MSAEKQQAAFTQKLVGGKKIQAGGIISSSAAINDLSDRLNTALQKNKDRVAIYNLIEKLTKEVAEKIELKAQKMTDRLSSGPTGAGDLANLVAKLSSLIYFEQQFRPPSQGSGIFNESVSKAGKSLEKIHAALNNPQFKSDHIQASRFEQDTVDIKLFALAVDIHTFHSNLNDENLTILLKRIEPYMADTEMIGRLYQMVGLDTMQDFLNNADYHANDDMRHLYSEINENFSSYQFAPDRKSENNMSAEQTVKDIEKDLNTHHLTVEEEEEFDQIIQNSLSNTKTSDDTNTAVAPKQEEPPSSDVLADREKFAFSTTSPIALVDVDSTLIGDAGEPNMALIEALKNQDITKVILFSASYADLIPSQAAQKSTRVRAIELLEEHGITVLTTVISSSPRFEKDKPLGTYFEKTYRPYEETAVALKNQGNDDIEDFGFIRTEMKKDKNYQALLANEEIKSKENSAFPTQYKDNNFEGGKEEMLRHVLNRLPEGAHVAVCDDRSQVTNVVEAVSREHEIQGRGIKLEAMPITMTKRGNLTEAEDRIKGAINRINRPSPKDEEKLKIFKKNKETAEKQLPEFEKKRQQEEIVYNQAQNADKEKHIETLKTFRLKIPEQRMLPNIFITEKKEPKINETNLNSVLSGLSYQQKIAFINHAFYTLKDQPLTNINQHNIKLLKRAYLETHVHAVGQGKEIDLDAALKSDITNFRNSTLPFTLYNTTGTYDALVDLKENKDTIAKIYNADPDRAAFLSGFDASTADNDSINSRNLAILQKNTNINKQIATLDDQVNKLSQEQDATKRGNLYTDISRKITDLRYENPYMSEKQKKAVDTLQDKQIDTMNKPPEKSQAAASKTVPAATPPNTQPSPPIVSPVDTTWKSASPRKS